MLVINLPVCSINYHELTMHIKPLPHNLDSTKKSLLKILWEKKKMPVTSILSIFRNVSILLQTNFAILSALTHSHPMTPFDAPGKQAF